MSEVVEQGEPVAGGRRYKGQTADERRLGRRGRLIDAAFELFGTAGYPATSIPTLCAHAGVNTRQFYEAFETREDLFVAVYDRVLHELPVQVTEAVAHEPMKLESRVHAGINALVAYVTDDPRRARIICVEAKRVSPSVEEYRRSMLVDLAGLIDREWHELVDRGVLEYQGYPALAIALAGAIDSTLSAWVMQQPPLEVSDVRKDLVLLFVAVSRTMLAR